jgi:hypothetical protein
MNSIKSPFEQWLEEMGAEIAAPDGEWDPGFDGRRQLVIAKLGPFRKIYRRSANFKKRFYHTVYPLPIEEWGITEHVQLYGGFCSVEAALSIRFQASITYAQAHSEALPEINRHIKAGFEGLIRDAAVQELRLLDDGKWVETGLARVEKQLQTTINETLAVQHIHCRALCEMQATFADAFDAAQLDSRCAREDIYLKVLKKNFEVRERQEQERFRQEQALEEQRLAQEQRLIEQQNREDELKRAEQEQAARNLRLRLEDRERQLAEQLLVEQRLHREKLKHQQHLHAMEKEIEAEEQQHRQSKQFQLERQLQEEQLEHQQQLKAKQLTAEIEDYARQQITWNEANERFRIAKIQREERLKQMENAAELKLQESKLLDEQNLQERLLEEKLKHESRLKEMELQMQIQEQKKRYEETQQVDEYLRHDIELLILEQHRSELVQAIKKAKQDLMSPQGLPPGANT